MKKGYYFIACDQVDREGNKYKGITLEEGSFELKGKLFVHRREDNNSVYGWRVSHFESGSNICYGKSIEEARAIAKKLQKFTLWDLKTWQELTLAVQHNPDYIEEVEQIRIII
tara:strand:+ start:351 stop:689 length:339 start_codon:yes stop_codon:yes gene_type:complete